ncbi:MAG: MalY/PatB family protein [Longimicrobiales bacterium]
MAARRSLDRRAFLRKAGAAGVLGAVAARDVAGAERLLAAEPGMGSSPGAPRMRGPGALPQTPDFDGLYARVGTDCSKWDGPRAEYGDAIQVAMGIADQDFRAAPCITRALAERCAHENWGYLRLPDSFIRSIVDWNQRRYGLEIDPGTVELTTGVHAGLIFAIRTFAPPGTRVLMTTPVYSGFYSDIRFTRTVAEECPMVLEDGRYRVDFDDFDRRARRSNVFILCNPQNPTGNAWSAEDMTRMGEICLEHGVPVLVDEIHCDFVSRGEEYIPFASLPNREIVDNSLTFKSASKSFSISAMKVAWYFSTNPSYLERVRLNTRADLSTLGVVASDAALRDGDGWLDALIPYIDGTHELVARRMKDDVPLVSYTKAQGTYLAWIDVSEALEAIGAEEIAARESERAVRKVTPEEVARRWFAETAGVYLNPGSNYGPGGEGKMRMNLATSRILVNRALDNMAEALGRV